MVVIEFTHGGAPAILSDIFAAQNYWAAKMGLPIFGLKKPAAYLLRPMNPNAFAAVILDRSVLTNVLATLWLGTLCPFKTGGVVDLAAQTGDPAALQLAPKLFGQPQPRSPSAFAESIRSRLGLLKEHGFSVPATYVVGEDAFRSADDAERDALARLHAASHTAADAAWAARAVARHGAVRDEPPGVAFGLPFTAAPGVELVSADPHVRTIRPVRHRPVETAKGWSTLWMLLQDERPASSLVFQGKTLATSLSQGSSTVDTSVDTFFQAQGHRA